MTMNERPGLRRELTLLLVVVVAVACLPVQSTMADESSSTQYSNGFAFDQAHGMNTQASLLLSGISDKPLRNATWSLVNISTSTPITLLSGPYLTSVVPVGKDSFRWTLDINVTGIDCTCFISLQTNWEDTVPFEPFLVAFIGQAHHRPILLDEIGDYATSESVETQSVVSGDAVELEFQLITPSGQYTELQFEAELCQAPFGVCLDEPIVRSIPYSSQGYVVTLTLNQSTLSLPDGIWFVDVSMKDDLLRQSGKVRSSVTFDSTPPTGSISGPDRVLESEEFQLYAELSDGFEGSKLTNQWSIHHDGGTIRAVNDSELISTGTILLNLTDSGDYHVELFVRDQAGFSITLQHNFSVENIKPQVILVADGLQINGNQRVEVGPGSNWTLDGTYSIDNEPIEYLWVIDESTSIRGQSQLNFDDFDGEGLHSVELIVFDDDGATDSISFEIVITSSEDSVSTLISPIQAVSLLFVIVLILVFVIRSTKKVDFDIPKWNTSDGTVPDGTLRSPNGHDATVEEDEARG